MKTWIFVPALLLLLTLRMNAAPIETLPKSEILKIDRTELKFTVKLAGSEQTRILQITSETRFFKDEKYAISEDLAVGDSVHGKVQKRADGVYEALRIYILKHKMLAAVDPRALGPFDLPRPQPGSFVRRPAASDTNAPAPVEDIALQNKAASDLNLHLQRHEAMNGSPLLSQRPVGRDSSRFQRTLDSLSPTNGAFLQKNPNALSGSLNSTNYWTK